MNKSIYASIVMLTLLSGCGNGAKQAFSNMEKQALAQPYLGVATPAGIEKGLFPIQQTGVSTIPIVTAANNFLASLSAQQKKSVSFAIDDVEWRKWLNVDNGIYTRQGISLKQMNAEQKEFAFALMAESFSAKGLAQTKDIMKTDQTLKEMTGELATYDEELYFFTVMGSPSESEPWGWQIDGHHLAVNYFVLADQVVFSPAFMGAEPVITTEGKHKGNRVLQEEQNLGLAFMQSLGSDLQKKAVIKLVKSGEDTKAAGFQDNLILDYQGLQGKNLSAAQQTALLSLIEEYVGNIRTGHAAVKMEEVKAHLDNTWFAWIGGVSDDAVFYYRIHSPVVLIEFDHQGPIAVRAKGQQGPAPATRNHIHTMIRTPNGNDYGKDLLRQHLERHHH